MKIDQKTVLFRKIVRIFSLEKPCYLENRVSGGLPVSLFCCSQTTDNGHPERAFFQKFETFGLGQTNWAEILGGILAISSQTIGTILAL